MKQSIRGACLSPLDASRRTCYSWQRKKTSRSRTMHNNDLLPGGEQPHLSAHVQKNRAMWEATSDDYEARHAAALAGTRAMAWGLFRIPEDELQVLGEVAGKDILEFGCGAARWSIALAQAGARPVGLDLSPRQLQHARRLLQEAGVDFPLIEASAEDVPLPDGRFDIVFCQNIQTDQLEQALINDYFGLHRLEWEDEVNFQLPYGEWIRLFRQAGLVVEDLIETRPPSGATSTYRSATETEWARHWPIECIWKLRKAP